MARVQVKQPDVSLNATFRILFLMLVLIQIAWIMLFAYFLHYFQKLKEVGCKCAIGWRSKVLQVVMLSMIGLLVLQMALRGKYGGVLSLVQFLLVITFIVVTRQFLHATRSTQCVCAQTTAFRALDIVNIIMIFMLVLMLLRTFAGIFLAYMFAKK